MWTLERDTQKVTIDQGELVSYTVNGHEFIHQKGSPGWGSADTEMFPIIGPVNDANFRVQVPKGSAVQDQHGLLRQFPYQRASVSTDSATYVKHYKAHTPIRNTKYPEKSTEAWLVWPYSFAFEKQFQLLETGLVISFHISGEHNMPFMLGYHPAFKLHTKKPLIKTPEQTISLEAVLAVGSRALQVPNCERITLEDQHKITITTSGFGHFMCWTEVPNMVC
ncbi:MAG: aldose 1-epimerase, partial [Bacteroidota bacterium]